jgi:peptidyl-prolyl cis-trans isomerase C
MEIRTFHLQPARTFIHKFLVMLVVLILLPSCKSTPTTEQIATETALAIPSPTVTPVTPTPTPIPLAARVNDSVILLADYQAEKARYAAASGHEITAEESQLVLDDLIATTLLAEGAREKGFTADADLVQTRMDALVTRLGNQAALDEWLVANSYSIEDFQRSLALQIEAAWMRDEIAKTVPLTADQVRARQILLRTSEQTQEVQARLQAGEKFSDLAAEFDPTTEGDLGWFPPGYLYYPELDQVIFKLQPGQWSETVQTLVGFHIVEVIERDPQHPLSPDALRMLQSQAVLKWVDEQRSSAQVEIPVP